VRGVATHSRLESKKGDKHVNKAAIGKGLAFLVCAIFLLTSALAFGTGNGEKGTTSTSNGTRIYSDPGVFPIVKSKVTLTFLTYQHAAVVDYATNEFTKWMEAKTGVNIDWQVIPSRDNVPEKVNLVLASGKYPDVFFGVHMNASQIAQYGVQEKVFLPLEGIIDSQAPELKAIFKEVPGSRDEITSLDGHIYSMPEINQCYHCAFEAKMWINKTWLDNLGLKMPTTTDELYATLKAFKERDPNKNGKADEIPMAGAQRAGWENTIDKFLMNSFLFYLVDTEMDTSDPAWWMGLSMDKGKVIAPFSDPAMKEGLRYLNKLYKEGLIYEGSFTQDNNQLTQLVENPDAELVGVIPAGYGGMFSTVGDDRYRQFVAMAPLKGPKGVQYAANYPYEGTYQGAFVVSKNNKYPEVSVKWADLLYTMEATTRLTMGRPDLEWRYPKTGELGIDGKPALWVPIRPWQETTPQNESFVQVGPTKRTSAYRMGQYMDSNIDMYSGDGLEKLLYAVSKNQYEPYAPVDKALPHIKFTKEENDELTSLRVELGNHIRESVTKFIVGNLSIDSDYNGFLQDLDKLQLKRVLDIYQKAFDRQSKGK
jgi:putative aldouronate transport system substrate-binding protein